MKSPYSFIVKAYNNRRYDNIKSYGDIDFITSTSEEDHTSSNRFATVIETPINYSGPVKAGDTLLVHLLPSLLRSDSSSCKVSHLRCLRLVYVQATFTHMISFHLTMRYIEPASALTRSFTVHSFVTH